MSNLGIPYMGSKRKLASDILKVITSRHKGITDFYDLFGGGGSISFNAINSYNFNVHYNELNKHIYCLVEYLKMHKTLEPKFYEWVTREEFFKQCNRLDADWYSGFVMSCWSFGNKQSSYIYGSDIEDVKRLAHEFIVNGCLDSMAKIGVDIDLSHIKNIQKRRMVFCNYIKNVFNKRMDLQNIERVQTLELVEHLCRLQNPHPVYISEYSAPFEMVEMFCHRSSLSATNNKKKTVESIFWNGKGEVFNGKLF